MTRDIQTRGSISVRVITTVCCFGSLCPPVLLAEGPARVCAPVSSPAPKHSDNVQSREGTPPRVTDVQLDAHGRMQGSIVDSNGQPCSNRPVWLVQHGVIRGRAVSDESGQFVIENIKRSAASKNKPLSGGLYQIATSDCTRMVRIWTSEAAPPSAVPKLMMVPNHGSVVRGQITYGDVFASDAFLIGGSITTAVAIPAVLYNNRSHKPSAS